MTVLKIVKQYLVDGGYDGLYHPGTKCGCGVEDLAPCSNMNERECVAATRHDNGLYYPADMSREYKCATCGRVSYPDYGRCAFCGDRAEGRR